MKKTETIKAFQIFSRENYSRTDDQRLPGPTYPPTLAGLVEALDRAAIEHVEMLGCSGSGAGAWVEAVFDDDEDNNIVIDHLDQSELSDCAPLEIGASRLALARRAGRLERTRVWDGHNHVTIGAAATRMLIERFTCAEVAD